MQKRIYFLFFLSGISGLIYEATWARYLKMFLGHSSYGQILTLCIYMGGLGIGSFLAAKWSHKIKSLYRAYAYTEIAIAIGGLSYHFLYLWVTDWFYSSTWAVSTAEPVKIVLSILMTTPWAILLGMTFPFVANGLLRQGVGEVSLSRLYFTNSIGAAVGILLASYILIPLFGSPGSLHFAVGLNLLIALAFWFLAKAQKEEKTIQLFKNEALTVSTDRGGERIRLWLFISLLTGLTSFIYEVGWIRMLSLMMGSSTHSFDIMISAFIVGIALGAWVSRKKLQPGKDLIRHLSWVQVGMGFFALLTVYFYHPFFSLMNEANHFFAKTDGGYIWLNLFKYGVSLLWMVPTSFFAGMTLPTLSYVVLHWSKREDSVGRVYGWNTIGAILGAFAGGMILLPLLQLKWMLASAAAFDMATGLYLLWLYKYKEAKRLWIPFVLLLLPLLFVQFDGDTLTAGVFRGYKSFSQKESQEVAHGRAATISFHESPVHYYIKTNGKPDASLSKDRESPIGSDELTQAATAFVPMAVLDEPYDAAMVGFGSGMSAYYLLSDPLLRSLDVVEIESEMVRLARGFYPLNDRAFDDPRCHIYYDDARTWFHTAQKKYDVLVSVPSNPWVSGVSSLFSYEFYGHVQRYLTKRGMLVQWLQLYEFETPLLFEILKALHKQFKHVVVYRIPDEPDVILMASQEEITQKHISRFSQKGKIQNTFAKMQRNEKFFGEQNFVFNTQQMDVVLEEYEGNSDFYPLVDTHAEKARFKGSDVKLLDAFSYTNINYLSYLDSQSYQEHLQLASDYWTAQEAFSVKQHSLQAMLDCKESPCLEHPLAKHKTIDWEEVLEQYNKSLKSIPFGKTRLELPLYKTLSKWMQEEIPPYAVRLEFWFWDFVLREKWAEASLLIPEIRKEFYLHTLEIPYLRAMALVALQVDDKKLFRVIFRLGVQHNKDFEYAEKRLLLALYQNKWKKSL